MSTTHVLGDLISCLGLLGARTTQDSLDLFREEPCYSGLPAGAYLRDFVLEGQLLPLHTFIEREDESNVVSVRLPNRAGSGGQERTVNP